MSAEKLFCTINGYRMAYVDIVPTNNGDSVEETLIFLHGNPTSSYLWRNIMEPLRGDERRLIAPDLIGMGDSDKLSNSSDETYRFLDHSGFLDQLLECVLSSDEQVVLVIHDWGSALGFYWAYRFPERIRGIVYMEAVVAPFEWEDFRTAEQEFFQLLRTPQVGESLVLEQNFFLEAGLQGGILRNLTEDELNVYLAPFVEAGESRRPMLTWPREIPINGTPADNHDLVQTYSTWMATNNIPKLFINAEPGVLITGRLLEFVRTWKNQTELTVSGLHFIQEDSPSEIAEAIEDWLDTLPPLDLAPSASPTSGGRALVGFHFWWLLFLVWALRKTW